MPHWAASLDAILKTSLDAVIAVDRQGLVRGWNHHAESIFGWSAQDVLGRPAEELVVSESYREQFQIRLSSLNRGDDAHLVGRRQELTACRSDGSEVPIEVGVMTAGEGDRKVLVYFIRDLTPDRQAVQELAEAQDRLRASEELYRYAIELSSLIPWTTDAAGRVLTLGDRWAEWTGTPVSESLGTGWVAFLHPDEVDLVTAKWADAIRTGCPFQMEYRLRTRDGSFHWCHARATKHPDSDGEGAIWYGTLEDVHERHMALEAFHRTQAELARVSRLSAMGAMATAIAHDLNQPLTASAHYIRGCRRLLNGLQGHSKSEIEDGLLDADDSIVRASDIVRRVRDFVGRGTIERSPERLVRVVEEASDIALEDSAVRGISHRSDFQFDGLVLIDRVQVQQVVVNLIRNAAEALDGLFPREILIRTREVPGDLCEVSVRDTGPGVPPDVAERLFDPFYTTRRDGMGVGLSICRTIVEAHGGTIWYEPNPKGGTIMAFTLPTIVLPTGQVPEAAE